MSNVMSQFAYSDDDSFQQFLELDASAALTLAPAPPSHQGSSTLLPNLDAFHAHSDLGHTHSQDAESFMRLLVGMTEEEARAQLDLSSFQPGQSDASLDGAHNQLDSQNALGLAIDSSDGDTNTNTPARDGELQGLELLASNSDAGATLDRTDSPFVPSPAQDTPRAAGAGASGKPQTRYTNAETEDFVGQMQGRNAEQMKVSST